MSLQIKTVTKCESATQRVSASSFSFRHHPSCPEPGIRRNVIQAIPSKVEIGVCARKTGIRAAVEPPPSLVIPSCAVDWTSVVIRIEGCEVHSTMVPTFVYGSVGQGIAGLSTESGEAKGVFVAFRINRKGIVLG